MLECIYNIISMDVKELEKMTLQELLSMKNRAETELKKLEKEYGDEGRKTFGQLAQDKQNNGLGHIKLSDNVKKKLQLKRLIRLCSVIYTKKLHKDSAEKTLTDLQDIKKQPKFSWGIEEFDSSERSIIFEEDEIKATALGIFEWAFGRENLSLEQIRQQNIKTVNLLGNNADKVRLPIKELEKLLKQSRQEEILYLFRIERQNPNGKRNYYILSPITKKLLENEKVRNFFTDVYCSHEYLKSISESEDGIYAGNICIDDNGNPYVRYNESSTRAAKLAESVQGTTTLEVKISDVDRRKLPGSLETFRQVRYRIAAEQERDNQYTIEDEN